MTGKGTELAPKALVVEDEPLIRMGAVDICESVGFVVSEAANAEQAIVLLSTDNAFDLLLTDIDMPGSMDGVALAWRAREFAPLIAVIVVSGKMVVPKHELPPNSRFFAKPVQEADVRAAIAEMAILR